MSKLKLAAIAVLIVVAAIGTKGYLLYQAISPNPISFWQMSDETSARVIDHQIWASLLKKHLSTDSQTGFRTFDYQGVSNADKQQLSDYLMQLQGVDPRTLNRNEQLAFWANLYNALTIDVVLKHYPIESIKDIGDGITGPWNIELATISDQTLTLNKIEHGILRALWKDSRIHYVINCASVGCPDLPSTPLIGSKIETQLNTAATRFINQSKGVTFINDELVLSSIYNWFSVDFGDNEQQLLTHLIQFSAPALTQRLKEYKGTIDFEYNWKLNAPQ